MRRRTFLRKTMAATTVWFAQKAFPLEAKDLCPPALLTILHTNDLHGFIGRYATGLKQMVAEVRRQNPCALLFDTGDFMPEGDLGLLPSQVAGWMKEIGYSAITFGHQEMKGSVGMLSKQFSCVKIPVVLSNRGGWMPECESVLNAFQIIETGTVRVGVMGIGGLLSKENVQWSDIVDIANSTSNLLKEGYRCDFVVCLSRLGFCYADKRPSDLLLAESSRQIDLILGGGTHTFMQEAQQWHNAEGKPVWVSHAGFGGRLLGKLDLSVLPSGGVKLVESAYLPVYSASDAVV
jgi:5'-nucleotidase